ncbi:24029_t:CDS:10 [Cetraspora pellucida]|uniref:24029_t:CDS:1 n=2 Tax=Cetraspora pellucida TaxID=1433469 RepID=A0A9N9CVG0_9GLOM|nr:24029_t:CDS:10 [Cetraspora pellucida]
MDQRKRRPANVFGDEDEQMVKAESDSKKIKNVSVGVPSFIPTPTDPSTVQNAAPRPDQIKAMIAQKRAQLEAMAANFKPPQPKTTLPVQPPVVSNLPFQPSLVASGIDPDLRRKIQEAKEKIKVNLAKANPYLPSTNPLVKLGDDSIKAKGGLKVESHPALLLDQSGKLDLKRAAALMPKPNFATVKANQRLAPAISRQEAKALAPSEELDDITQNPYYDPRAGAAAPQRRVRKKFKFVQPGKYEALGNHMRAQAKLEKLKEEIAESVKKAGMEAEIDSTDKAIKRDPPPVIEWWDLPFLLNKSYDDIDAGLTKIDDEDSLATWFVQHPVPIRPPGDNGPPPPKPLILTKREQKKLRKQRRLELQKEKQDKIRLGLLPPDLPKVKLSNLMRVLTNDAVQDPTKIEAQMKFKVDMNAQQLGLSGTVIINPNFTVVIVEGGPKAIKYYKKLMLRRIDWSDTTRIGEGSSEQPVDEPMEPPKENKCSLIWEGEVKDHGFKGFWFKTCPTEKMARDYLRKHKSEHYWDLACKYVDDGFDNPAIVGF